MQEVSPQYLAGMLDGEGCLMMTRLHMSTKEAARGVRYAPVMTIANTYVPMLQAVQLVWGGRIREEGNGSQTWALYFSANEIRRILPLVLPYLIVKREQANVLMDYLAATKAHGPRNLSDERFAQYEQWFGRLRELKHVRFHSAGA